MVSWERKERRVFLRGEFFVQPIFLLVGMLRKELSISGIIVVWDGFQRGIFGFGA